MNKCCEEKINHILLKIEIMKEEDPVFIPCLDYIKKFIVEEL